MEDTQQKRQTAYKITLSDIIKGDYVKNEGWEPSYIIDPYGRHVSRVNILATMISALEINGSSQSFTIDDGTAKMLVRSFDRVPGLDSAAIGDLVMVIGKIREYNDERYIIPELVRPTTEDWLAFRKKELSLLTPIVRETPVESIPQRVSKPVEDIEDTATNDTETVYLLIKELDKGDGADIDEVIKKAKNSRAEAILNTLLMEGEVFQVSPGKIKVLE
ncbi:hypothetical protein H6504_03235 [Candidatus Woesearchaeota archaeon]|nr:hypothetical protein [Candidatus Woesearchaeota archaeon]